MRTDPWDFDDSQPPRNRRIGRTATVIICAVVVAIAVLMSYGEFSYREFPFSSPRDYVWGSDYYEEDFFPEISGEYSLPRAETGTGITLELKESPEDELSLQEIYSLCAPSVVAITASVDGTGYYWGTGVIFHEAGYILTNAHLIDGTTSAIVKLVDDSEYEAKLVGADEQSDLAVLKIDGSGFTPAVFGESSSLSVGDEVVAIGNPLGEAFRSTMTDGIISAIDRDIPYDSHTMTLLQTNAAINEGNSGGPLINMYGQVIGITNMKMSSSYSTAAIEGIGFAIPSASLKPVVDSLVANGEVRGRPGIGIVVGGLPEDISWSVEPPAGLYINSVQETSDAWAKGVRAGDILLAVNGEPVVISNEVSVLKDSMSVGETVILTIWRDGSEFDVDVLLMDMNDLY